MGEMESFLTPNTLARTAITVLAKDNAAND